MPLTLGLLSGMIPNCRISLRPGWRDKLTQRPGTSSVAALALARTMQRRAAENADLDMLVDAVEYENRALAAIKLHLPELPPKMPRQLRLPGL